MVQIFLNSSAWLISFEGGRSSTGMPNAQCGQKLSDDIFVDSYVELMRTGADVDNRSQQREVRLRPKA